MDMTSHSFIKKVFYFNFASWTFQSMMIYFSKITVSVFLFHTAFIIIILLFKFYMESLMRFVGRGMSKELRM